MSTQPNQNTSPDDDQSSNTSKTEVTPHAAAKAALDTIRDEFVHDDPPETVGGNINDFDRVRECITAAVNYFHGQLTDSHRNHIQRKWGISGKMIDARKIGFCPDDNSVIEHLEDEGFGQQTIARAALGTPSVLKHVFKCGGISPNSMDLLPEEARTDYSEEDAIIEVIEHRNGDDPEDVEYERIERQPVKHSDSDAAANDLVDEDECSHEVSEPIEILKWALRETKLSPADAEPLLTPEEIDLTAVIEHAKANDNFTVWNWWDNRIVFPYKDGNGEFCHFAGRMTTQTEDIVYKNNVENKTDADHITVTVDMENGTPVFEPPAIAVSPGTDVTFEKAPGVAEDLELKVKYAAGGVWWDDGMVPDLADQSCDDIGLYLYRVTVDGVGGFGAILATDSFNKKSRYKNMESWLDDAVNYQLDRQKYLKFNKSPWLNTEATTEPIFGMETVHEGHPLVATEGITDAIMLHQHNIPCISPATTEFAKEHYDVLCSYAETAGGLFIVNDSEENDAGLDGALRTARYIETQGHDVGVGELPRPNGRDKIDVADFLKEHVKKGNNPHEEFIKVLQDAISPQNHPKFDPEEHEPSDSVVADTSTTDNTSGNSSSGSYDDDDDETLPMTAQGLTDWKKVDIGNKSAIWEASLRDVMNLHDIERRGGGGTPYYRGVNPIHDHHANGDSENYFVIRDHGDHLSVKDYVKSSGYNALGWMACDADCGCDAAERPCDCDLRTVANPNGSFSNEETWHVWRHAKETPYVNIPDDDPIPRAAMAYLIDKHNLLPDEFKPEELDDKIPPTKYNEVLELIENEYGINPGRDQVNTSN